MTEPLPFYEPHFLSREDDAVLRAWLATLHPLWENRRAPHRTLRQGQTSSRLLRPVYWLGNWQFACLDYYRPPREVHDRCVQAEPFPPRLAELVRQMEEITRRLYSGPDLPEAWTLNTCLINLYGVRWNGRHWIDSARVRDHKDFEPGPVASLSMGERALFQFVENHYPEPPGAVIAEQWLGDGSLQIFGGEHWKDRVLHRVTRVERNRGHHFEFPALTDFKTRRINFTFRYVPKEHIVPFARLGEAARRDIHGHVQTLAQSSSFFAEQLARGS